PRLLSKAAVDAKLELLEAAAFRLFASGKEQFTSRELRRAVRDAHGELYPNRPLTDAEVTEHIDEWTEQDGVLVEAGADEDSNAPYLFLHLTFQEYLAGCHLAQRINDCGWEKATVKIGSDRQTSALHYLDRKAWLPSWQEVIVLLAGQLN